MTSMAEEVIKTVYNGVEPPQVTDNSMAGEVKKLLNGVEPPLITENSMAGEVI